MTGLKNEKLLLNSIRSGDGKAFEKLINAYRPMLASAVSRCMANGSFDEGESEDLFQEASAAFYRASLTYKENESVTFGLYARICIKNALTDAVKRLNKEVNQTGFDTGVGFDDGGLCLTDGLEKLLSPVEKKVIELRLCGHSNEAIANAIGKDRKSVENALYRIRIKIKKNLI